jgi:membrane protein required for colicin V production
MVTLDYILLAVILGSAVVGAFRGFLREVISVISWVLAIWLAWMLAPALAPKLGGALRDPVYGLWAARGLIFLLVVIAGYCVGAVVNHLVRLSMFSGLDRLLGFLLGVARGLVVIAVGIILGQAAQLDGEAWWQKSRLTAAMQPLAGMLRALAGEHMPPSLAGED